MDDEIHFDAQQTTRWFGERVIGQQPAVDLIVQLLGSVKAGLTRPHRPIASLLFAGPTGTGKTEMAKSLARFFFGNEERMARFDMSEFADALAVTRLVGGATGGEGTLTARIREQPFSVLLFDEFEKAHHSFFDLLLQTLGEGRLTDGRGRVADFTNAIIVMTSNLGAERFRRARPGFHDDRIGEEASSPGAGRAVQKHFARAVQDFLRPEIFNRIDHIVPFLPLDATTVERIAERELRLIEQREGIRLHGVALNVTNEALALMARRGYDARYGARPLKHLIERELLLPLAIELNSRPPAKKSNSAALVASVSIESGRLRISITESGPGSRSAGAATAAAPTYDERSMAFRAAQLGDLRRRVGRLGRSSSLIELRNTIWRLTETERRIAKSARRTRLSIDRVKARHAQQRPSEASALTRLPEYRQLADTFARIDDETASAEDHLLQLLYSSDTATDLIAYDKPTEELNGDLNDLLRQLLDLGHPNGGSVTLAIYSENRQSLFDLARGYYMVAVDSRMSVTLAYYTADLPRELTSPDTRTQKQTRKKKRSVSDAKSSEDDPRQVQMFGRKVARMECNDPEPFLSTPPPEITAIVFHVIGPRAFLTYQAEQGIHSILEGRTTHNIFVHASDAKPSEYEPPELIERRGSITPSTLGERRRTYNQSEGFVDDRPLNQRLAWNGKGGVRELGEALKYFLNQQLTRSAEKLLDE